MAIRPRRPSTGAALTIMCTLLAACSDLPTETEVGNEDWTIDTGPGKQAVGEPRGIRSGALAFWGHVSGR